MPSSPRQAGRRASRHRPESRSWLRPRRAARWRARPQGSFRSARDRHRDRGALTLFRLKRDISAMGFDELPSERQAQTERCFSTDAGFLYAVETVEHARQVILRNAGTIVADADHHLLLLAVGLQLDPTLPVSVRDSVLKHVLNGLAQAPSIAKDEPGFGRDLRV